MGFIAPALPFILKAGAGIGASMIGRKVGAGAAKRSPEEQAALTGATGAAGRIQQGAAGLAGQGNRLFSTAMPFLQQGGQNLGQAGSYFGTLLRGNRAAMQQAVAGPTADITGTYRGAERNLEKQGVRGGERSLALAELGRGRASDISRLTTGVQPAAATALAGVGGDLSQIGLGASGQGIQALAQALSGEGDAGRIFANLLGQGMESRKYGEEQKEKGGATAGRILGEILGSGKWGGGKSKVLGSTPIGGMPGVTFPNF